MLLFFFTGVDSTLQYVDTSDIKICIGARSSQKCLYAVIVFGITNEEKICIFWDVKGRTVGTLKDRTTGKWIPKAFRFWNFTLKLYCKCRRKVNWWTRLLLMCIMFYRNDCIANFIQGDYKITRYSRTDSTGRNKKMLSCKCQKTLSS